MKIDLDGRTALITGGSKGLGLAMAKQFAESGARVAIVARDAATLEEAHAAIAALAGTDRVTSAVCDVTSAEQIRAAWQTVTKAVGDIDILVNNAGHHATSRFLDISDEAWEADLQLKLMASVRMTRLAWPGMIERRWGRVINVLNTFSKAPAAGTAPTSVSRAAQLALTKVLSQEGAPHNVLVNALLVGLIKSDQIVRLHRDSGAGQPLEAFIADFANKARIPLGRFGEADEFARIACFLASDAASYITGSAINVDGGSTPVV
jgi:3-oxoacyl-[acyl-carrier protein] reductase